MYKNENKLSIKNTFVKIINESFTIYFLKNILFNEYGSIYSCNKYISNLLQPIKSYIINVLTKIVPLLNSINYFPYSKIHIHNNSAITNYIKMLGIKESKLIYGNIKSKFTVVPDRVECTKSIYTYSVIELRFMLIKRIKCDNYKKRIFAILFFKRIYSGKIKYFDESVHHICNYNMSIICMIYKPTTSFGLMIHMFCKADIIFGPHGAGFTNIIVSKKSVIIFELIKRDHPVLYFATLSNILGFTYYGVYMNYNTQKDEFDMNFTSLIYMFNDFCNYFRC